MTKATPFQLIREFIGSFFGIFYGATMPIQQLIFGLFSWLISLPKEWRVRQAAKRKSCPECGHCIGVAGIERVNHHIHALHRRVERDYPGQRVRMETVLNATLAGCPNCGCLLRYIEGSRGFDRFEPQLEEIPPRTPVPATPQRDPALSRAESLGNNAGCGGLVVLVVVAFVAGPQALWTILGGLLLFGCVCSLCEEVAIRRQAHLEGNFGSAGP